MSQYFPELYGRSSGNLKFELNLSDYSARSDLKGALKIDTSTTASEKSFASFQTNVGN